MQPQNTSTSIGSEAVLTCVTGRSAPYPTVHWEMNDVRLENAKALTASYGEFDRTGLSAQVSMKLMYRVVDDVPRSFRCVAQNPLSGETVKSSAAMVTPTGGGSLSALLGGGGGGVILNIELKCVSLESIPWWCRWPHSVYFNS